jgi:hypothetical protein
MTITALQQAHGMAETRAQPEGVARGRIIRQRGRSRQTEGEKEERREDTRVHEQTQPPDEENRGSMPAVCRVCVVSLRLRIST